MLNQLLDDLMKTGNLSVFQDETYQKRFKELLGQVFIFSTNEEITKEHVEVIGNDLQAIFLIENVDNKKTSIEANKYFGEK